MSLPAWWKCLTAHITMLSACAGMYRALILSNQVSCFIRLLIYPTLVFHRLCAETVSQVVRLLQISDYSCLEGRVFCSSTEPVLSQQALVMPASLTRVCSEAVTPAPENAYKL